MIPISQIRTLRLGGYTSLTGDPLKKYVSPEPINITLFEKKKEVFADIIKIKISIKISKGDLSGLGWALQ